MNIIEVYADVWCPFAHVGLHTVVDRRRQLERKDILLRIRAWPLELINGAPLDPATTKEHVNELRAQVAPDLFADFDLDHFPHTSLPALALAAAAYRESDHAGEAVSLALRDALFEKGQDISNPGVLALIAEEYGVASGPEDIEAVVAEWHQGQSRGVRGSPHFICGSAEAFCPSLDISKGRDGHLQVRRNTQALDEFLQVCFPLVKRRP